LRVKNFPLELSITLFGLPNRDDRRAGASADEAHELLFDDDAGHALHFGEAAGEGGGAGLVRRIHGLRLCLMNGLIAISQYVLMRVFD